MSFELFFNISKDGIFWTYAGESGTTLNVSEISVDPLSELVVLVPILGLSVEYVRLFRATHDLMVSVSDFGTRGPGSIPGWAPIIPCFILLLSLAL